MRILYSLFIYCYGALLHLAAPFNKKASLWVEGRKNYFAKLDSDLRKVEQLKPDARTAWFHCASLGEFEQGRPIMEAFSQKYPDFRIIVTFFSPSGYEIRKNYAGAHLVTYLPLDTPGNARRFIEKINPDIVFYIKYEYWFNMLAVLQQKKIPTLLVSSIFRPGQHFFKWYGSWSRRMLAGFTQLFVQNQESIQLLAGAKIKHATLCGDTRFDRVAQVAKSTFENKITQEFCSNHKVLIAGSTWPADEALLYNLSKSSSDDLKIVIAPHETNNEHIQNLMNLFGNQAVCYSKTNETEVLKYRILIIDSVGMLSQLFRYGSLAYIGGGFGVSIHNILEPATFGLPVLFGPKMNKFKEANDLIELNSAFVIHNSEELISRVQHLLKNQEILTETGARCKKYVEENKGATSIVMNFVETLKL